MCVCVCEGIEEGRAGGGGGGGGWRREASPNRQNFTNPMTPL